MNFDKEQKVQIIKNLGHRDIFKMFEKLVPESKVRVYFKNPNCGTEESVYFAKELLANFIVQSGFSFVGRDYRIKKDNLYNNYVPLVWTIRKGKAIEKERKRIDFLGYLNFQTLNGSS